MDHTTPIPESKNEGKDNIKLELETDIQSEPTQEDQVQDLTTTSWTGRLPIELMQKIVDHLDDTQSFSSLHLLQQTCKTTYLLATPPMYKEIGYNSISIAKRFRPLKDVLEEDFEGLDDGEPVEGGKHPVEWKKVERLLWMYSHTVKIVYRPGDIKTEAQFNDQIKNELRAELEGLNRFTRMLGHAISDRSVMSNLAHFVVDLDLLPDSYPGKYVVDNFANILQYLKPYVESIPLCLDPGLYSFWSIPYNSRDCWTDTTVLHDVGEEPLYHALRVTRPLVLDKSDGDWTPERLRVYVEHAYREVIATATFWPKVELLVIAKPEDKDEQKKWKKAMDHVVEYVRSLPIPEHLTRKLSWEFLEPKDGEEGPVKCGGCGSEPPSSSPTLRAPPQLTLSGTIK